MADNNNVFFFTFELCLEDKSLSQGSWWGSNLKPNFFMFNFKGILLS